jgi:hypothetical protein
MPRTAAHPPPLLPCQAAAIVWPEIFGSQEAEDRKEELVEKMRAVRPVVETGCAALPGWCSGAAQGAAQGPAARPAASLAAGALLRGAAWLRRYENIVQIRCLYEGVTVEEMLASWSTMLPGCMQQWGLERGAVSRTPPGPGPGATPAACCCSAALAAARAPQRSRPAAGGAAAARAQPGQQQHYQRRAPLTSMALQARPLAALAPLKAAGQIPLPSSTAGKLEPLKGGGEPIWVDHSERTCCAAPVQGRGH